MKPPAKICHIVLLSHLSGVQRVMYDLCQSLDQDRYERHVICKEAGPLTVELAKHGIAFHLVPSLVRPMHPLKDLRSFIAIFRLCRKHGFDLVHTHSSKTGFLGRVAARLAGVPYVFHHIHGFAFHDYSSCFSRFIYSTLEKVAGWFSDRLIFVNDEERSITIENGWAPSEKCITIYNGTDLTLFQIDEGDAGAREEVRTRLGLDSDELVILICGRLDEQKQSLILPEIAASLQEKLPHVKWSFLVAGDGELEDELKREIQATGMEKRIRLLGWYPKPHELMAVADIKLLPSLWEGLPLTLIEALASGLPIVASDIKGNREVVNEETGYLCEPKDPHAYAEKLAKLCQEASTRLQMRSAARNRAENTFDLKKTCSRVQALYEFHLFGCESGEGAADADSIRPE